MRRLLATDLGIWPMIQSQERASDMMVNGPAYWARLADYLLMYDQVVIPTGNLQILSVLRFMLGDDVLLELLQTRTIVLTRFDQWFGYVGTGGVVFFKVGDGPENKRLIPNLATSHFLPLDQAIDAAFMAMNPASTSVTRQQYKGLLLDHTAQLSTESLLEGLEQKHTETSRTAHICRQCYLFAMVAERLKIWSAVRRTPLISLTLMFRLKSMILLKFARFCGSYSRTFCLVSAAR